MSSGRCVRAVAGVFSMSWRRLEFDGGGAGREAPPLAESG